MNRKPQLDHFTSLWSHKYFPCMTPLGIRSCYRLPSFTSSFARTGPSLQSITTSRTSPAWDTIITYINVIQPVCKSKATPVSAFRVPIHGVSLQLFCMVPSWYDQTWGRWGLHGGFTDAGKVCISIREVYRINPHSATDWHTPWILMYTWP